MLNSGEMVPMSLTKMTPEMKDLVTTEELDEMKERYRIVVVVDNIANANVLFPPHQNWYLTRIERDRDARINVRQDDKNGRVAAVTDLNKLRLQTAPTPSFALVDCILHLLRTGRSKRSGLFMILTFLQKVGYNLSGFATL